MINRLKHIYVAAILTLLYAPIVVMVAQSFNASKYRGYWTGFTLDWYGSLFESEEIFEALSNTLSIGLSAATITTVLGLLTCIALQGMRRRTRAALMSVANVPLLNADIVTGISLMLLFLAMGLRLGYGSILLAHIVFCLPYVMLCIMPRLMTLNQSPYEAALDLGASPFQAFRLVVLPELKPSIAAGFLLAFTMSADDFIITHFTKGAGVYTLPTKIYAELKLGVHPEMYALSALMFAAVFLLVFLIYINRKYMSHLRKESLI